MLPSLIIPAISWLSLVSALPYPPSNEGPSCDCSGPLINASDSTPGSSICRDPRLGPIVLPEKLPLGTLLSTYDRFGGLSPNEFLKKWTDEKGNFVYPPQNGFQLDEDGNAINGTMILPPGTLVDRFGRETGRFISAAAAPYSQRALPPNNLATLPEAPDFPNNYRVYRVMANLTVVGGPIRPWFGQPGLGAQFFTGSMNIAQLLEQGILQREDPAFLIASETGCGQ